MGERDKRVKTMVRNICKEYFSIAKWEIGSKKLRKLYMIEYDKLEDMDVKYILLYKLIYSEYMQKHKNTVYQYLLQLKNDMDNTPDYKEDFTGEYCNMLSVYCDCEEVEITKEERLEYYQFIYDYYKKIYEFNNSVDTYIRMINIKFNIERIQRNFYHLLKIAKEIHSIANPKAKSTLDQMLCEIKDIDTDLYRQTVNAIGFINQQ